MVSSPKFLRVLTVPSCAVPPRAATLSPEIYYTIVDREEEVGLDEVLGVELVERMREKGFVIKEWVDQNAILGHRSVGGFASHCGWNSLMEAAWNGVPILAWPLGGDQKINAGLVEMSGWGIWNKTWGWTGERVVKVEEIGGHNRNLLHSGRRSVPY